MSQLHFEVSVDTSGLRRGIKESNKTIGEWAKNAQRDGLAVDRTFGNLQKRILQFASIHFASQIGGEIIKVRGEFQQLGIAFETMLGSKAKADQIMSEAITFAQKTPFTLTDVASNIKQLMAMGIETEKVMDTMKSLGDVAAGVSVPLQRVAINYGQVATLGVLQGREVRDFAMAGIPLIDELAKNLGKAKSEIQEMVSAGQIGFSEVEKAFQTMAGEGGKFYNLMEKQNASVTGQISNLQDKIEVMLNSIGKSNEGLIYGGISGLSSLVENYQQVLDILKVIVATYGAYKAASIVVTLLREAEAAGTLAAALRRTALAQMFLNTAQKASPVGLALAGITALIGGYAVWQRHIKQTGTFTADLNKSITDEILKLDSLFKKLKSTGEGTKDRADAIKLANDRYGSYLDNLLTEKSTLEDLETAQRNATNALIANISVQKSKDKLSEVLGDVSEKFDKEFSGIVQKFGEVYGTDRIPEFVVAINDAIDKKIKAGGGQVKRGMLEFSDIAKDVYDEFVKEISQKTGFLEYDFKSFQDSFLDFAEFKSEKSGFVAQLEGMITAYQGIIDKFKKVGTGEGGGETSKEVEDIKKQISSLYEVLQTADEKDRRAIAERIVALQKELLLREMIAEAAVKAVRDQQVPGKIKPIQQNIFDGKVAPVKKTGAEIEKLTKKIKKATDEAAELQRKLSFEEAEKFSENMQGASMVLQELADTIRESNPDLADTIDNLGMLTNIGANLASGNYFAAAATGVQLLAASYKQALDTSKEENRIAEKWEDFEKWISLSNRELKQYIKLRDEAIGSSRYGGSDVLIDETKANIEETQKLLDELDLSFTLKGEGFFGNPYNDIEKKVQQTIDTLGGGILELEGNLKEWGVGFWKKVKGVFSYDLSQLLYDENGTFTTDKINELINEGIITDQAVIDAVDSYVELTDQLIEAEKNKQELLTATAASNIADSIIDGFSQGYDSAADFASNFENLMKDAVLNALKIQVLEEPLKDWYDAFAQAVESDGKLTSGEVSDLETWYNSIIESGLENYDRLSKLTGLDFGADAASQAGLSGAIRREMTEETAGELAGIWRRSSDDTRQIRDYTKTGINHLVAIEANTFNTVVELQKAVSKLDTLDEIAANTKPAQTSRDMGL